MDAQTSASEDEAELSKDDVKKIKALFQEQEAEIKSMEKQLKEAKDSIEKS